MTTGAPIIATTTPGGAGCPLRALRERLRGCGLRPTRQRVMLGWLLFGAGHRHVSAEQLFEEAKRLRIPVSLATVYNTLHGFAGAGLLREISSVGQRSWFDTNVDEHHHLLDEETGCLSDLDPGAVRLGDMPEPPAGYVVAGVDVIVRLRRSV
jgi:Fur family transcriptional regulator, iron response regulator